VEDAGVGAGELIHNIPTVGRTLHDNVLNWRYIAIVIHCLYEEEKPFHTGVLKVNFQGHEPTANPRESGLATLDNNMLEGRGIFVHTAKNLWSKNPRLKVSLPHSKDRNAQKHKPEETPMDCKGYQSYRDQQTGWVLNK
jgi:hypothetical protein